MSPDDEDEVITVDEEDEVGEEDEEDEVGEEDEEDEEEESLPKEKESWESLELALELDAKKKEEPKKEVVGFDTPPTERKGIELIQITIPKEKLAESVDKIYDILKKMAKSLVAEVKSVGEEVELVEGAERVFTVPKVGTKESWMLLSGLLMLTLMIIYYPFKEFWYENFSFFNLLMLIIFGIIVLRSLLHILASFPESKRLKSDPKLNRTMRLRGFIILAVAFVFTWVFFYLKLTLLVYICSSFVLLALYFIVYGARSVSKYEGMRLAVFFIGLYIIISIPVHEAFNIAAWGYTEFPMDPRNEVLLIVGTAFLISGVSLLRERIGFFTVWFLGNVIVLLIPLHEIFKFVSQEKYEAFDHGLIIIGSSLIITGYVIFAHRFRSYSKIEEHIQSGLTFFRQGQYKATLKEFKEAFWLVEGTGLIMDFDILWGLIGNTHFKLGDHEKALAHYHVALLINDKNPTVHNDFGNAYFYLRRYRRSLRSYDRALVLAPSNPVIHHNKALVLYSLGRFEESLEYFDKALELKPDFEVVWKDRGVALVNLDRFAEAITSFQKAIEVNPKSEAWFELGRTYYYQKEYQNSLHACDEAIKHFPSDERAYMGKALVLMILSRFKDAEVTLLQALELNEKNARAWDRLGNVKYALGEPDAAIQAFRRAIVHQSNHGEAKFNLARTLKMEGDDAEALDAYDQAVRNPGRTPQQEEKFREAQAFYEQMKAKQPADFKPWMYHGNLFFRSGALRKAIEQYDRALRLKSRNAKLWNLKGIAHRKGKEYQAAVKSFRRAVEVEPDYTEGYINIGNVFQINEKYSEAIHHYNKALELSPQHPHAIRNRRMCINKLRRSQRKELVPSLSTQRRSQLQKLRSTILEAGSKGRK